MSQLDLVVRGAMVYDGTGGPPARVEIGIQAGRIAQVGHGLSGRASIDAADLCAAPGFIDTHSHSDLQALVKPSLEAKLRQGITLELFGQDGISVAPVREQDVGNRRRQLAGLLTDPDVSWAWRSVDDYLSELDRARLGPDVAYLVPHGAVREAVIGTENRLATDAELLRMQAVLEKGIDEGAFGLSTGLIYPPCCYCDRRELVALCRVAAKRKVPVVVHLRSESDRLIEAMEEMFDVGKRSGVHVHISHFKIAGRTNWPKLAGVIAKAKEAADQGVKVTADQYPYIAGSTMMGAILPPWVHAGGPQAALERLRDEGLRRKMREQMLDPSEVEWDNFWKWSGPEGILIADLPSGNHRGWIGKTVKAVADQERKDPIEFALGLLREEKLGVAMVSFSQSEEVVEELMKLPYVNVCTDGLLGGRPHPRSFGTFPRVLGRYVREKKTLPLEQAIRKMSGLAADTFGFKDHGYLKPGRRANVVLFRAESVRDTATFEEPLQFPIGIEQVIVGGKVVLRGGELTGERPGQVLRCG